MNNEKSEAPGRNTDGDLPNNHREKLRTFFTPVISYERGRAKSDADLVNITDALMATYWG